MTEYFFACLNEKEKKNKNEKQIWIWKFEMAPPGDTCHTLWVVAY